MCSLESAMKEEAGDMRGTLNCIEDKVPGIKKSIEAIRTTSESLGHKEEDLDDQINDTFDQLVAPVAQTAHLVCSPNKDAVSVISGILTVIPLIS